MLQREVNNLSEWFILNPKKEDENKDTIKFRILQQRQMEDKYKQLKVVNDRYDALMKEHQKISSSLAATRKDRLDELKGGKETFLDLVGKLQHSHDERDRQGHLAELTKLAAQDIKDEFRQPQEFPDGSTAPVILDADTDFGDDTDG
jgi:ATP-dependent exoDNAse (exonuclease V) beta subunit